MPYEKSFSAIIALLVSKVVYFTSQSGYPPTSIKCATPCSRGLFYAAFTKSGELPHYRTVKSSDFPPPHPDVKVADFPILTQR